MSLLTLSVADRIRCRFPTPHRYGIEKNIPAPAFPPSAGERDHDGHTVLPVELSAIDGPQEDAIIGKNPDGVITNRNARAERIFGHSAGEMSITTADLNKRMSPGLPGMQERAGLAGGEVTITGGASTTVLVERPLSRTGVSL